MRNLSFTLILSTALFIACGDSSPPPECEYVSDCPANKICKLGMCVQRFPSPPGLLLPGSVILECNCWGDLSMNGIEENPWCLSGYDYVYICGDCCKWSYGYGCIEYTRAKLCK